MKKWIKYESNNYTFNYVEKSLAEEEIEEIHLNQERCFKYITSVLGVDFKEKIEYYLCNTPEEVGGFYGDNDPCNAFARKPNKVYAVYNHNVKCIGYHEDAHIISYKVSIPQSVFLREGLAMFFDKKHLGVHNLDWAIYLNKNQQYIPISKLIIDEEFYKGNWAVTYPIAGAFTEYLINYYGKEKYKEFYILANNDVRSAFVITFNKEVNIIEEEFLDYIRSHKISDEICKLINEEINR